jgi:uncharacterized protein YbjT (DUF2867 family)
MTGKGFRLVVVGASGMVGGTALRYALQHPDVGSVTAIGRRKLGYDHPKLNEVLHGDFSDCTPLANSLRNKDSVLFCLGAYTGAVPDVELRTVTTDYTIEFARVLQASSPQSVFAFLSGSGADQSGGSRIPFARYKGLAEKALLAAGFQRVIIFRPAYIYPVEPRNEPNIGYRIMRLVYPVFRHLFPQLVIRSDELAHVMVQSLLDARDASHRMIWENRDIQVTARALAASHVQPLAPRQPSQG